MGHFNTSNFSDQHFAIGFGHLQSIISWFIMESNNSFFVIAITKKISKLLRKSGIELYKSGYFYSHIPFVFFGGFLVKCKYMKFLIKIIGPEWFLFWYEFC
jgi:hypothetical protein